MEKELLYQAQKMRYSSQEEGKKVKSCVRKKRPEYHMGGESGEKGKEEGQKKCS